MKVKLNSEYHNKSKQLKGTIPQTYLTRTWENSQNFKESVRDEV